MNIATELDRELLAKIAAEAVVNINPSAPNTKRWINAIAKAVAEIENNPYMTYSHDSRSLLMLSETSGKIYAANGS